MSVSKTTNADLRAGIWDTLDRKITDINNKFIGVASTDESLSITRNGSGQITSYTENGIAFTVTYNGDNTVNTISGGGTITTFYYSSGLLSGKTVANG